MKNKQKLLGAACALVLAGSPAFAQDDARPERGDRPPRGNVEGQRGPGAEGHRPPPISKLIERFDANNDGMLQKSEAPDRFPEQAFVHLDTNGDGAIDATEGERAEEMRKNMERGDRRGPGPEGNAFREGRPDRPERGERPEAGERHERGPRDGAGFEQVLKRFDLNGDGKLQQDEAPDRMMRMFARLDKNSDGALDQNEVQNAEGPKRGQREGDGGQRPPRGDGKGRPHNAPDAPKE